MSAWEPPVWVDRLSGLAWRIVVIALAFAVIVGALVALASIVLPLILGLLFASALHPVFRRLAALRVPAALAALISILLLIGLLLGVGYATVRAVADQWTAISADLEQGVTKLVDAAESAGIAHPTGESIADSISQMVGEISNVLLTGAATIVPAIGSFIATLFLSLFVAFFFLRDGRVMWEWIVRRVGAGSTLLDESGRKIWVTVSAFVVGQATIAVIDAVLIGLGALVLGVPNVAAITLLTFLGAFVPYIGATIAGMVAVLLAVSDGGVALGLTMLAVVLVVQIVEGNVLQPWIQGHAVRLHPLVVALAVVAGGAIGGFLGIVLAVPVCAAFVVTVGQLSGAGLLGRGRLGRAKEVA